MALEEQAIKYRSLDDWFKTPQGVRVALAFASELKNFHSHLMGGTLLQLGSCGENLWLPSLRFQHKWIVTPYIDAQKASLNASLNGLPIDRNSIDCIIAPLTMEAFQRDKNPLDEMDRILKSMGYIIFLGINPWSFWGVSLKWRHLACFGGLSASLTSSFSVKRILMHRGYSQFVHTSFYYVPPVIQENLLRKLEFFNEMGKMIWPFPAGLYCLILQKQEPCSPLALLNMLEEEERLLENKPSLPAAGRQWLHK
ncbi:methyltransferase domain-containing protein [Legionella oakridgensis]|uniref:Methyltransferase domain protein n=2 Tax=Legionella oakridgensis TaxID=29423 RepID=W0B9I0_9GAMM|nr:methyltransferase domain-containing protein [Legionella oakridgensis]AHE67208.1 methyltransferase domain protein [Legionella oakridgensis ATCC 33761 = DSM 21215]ETO93172.1 methyltransferase domain protein [Legionella oakridgensis RV-2-2007]KTD37993.1 methyl-transferase [Legionella oakridgensis]STY20285.1 methyl-transferase [Legionella longbeachae]